MREPKELPPLLTGDEQNQIQQLRDYLVRLAQRPEEQTSSATGGDDGGRIEAAEGSISGLNAAVKGLTDRVSDLWNTIYPVGAIYISTASTSPAELFGGSWERITGRFLLAATDGGAAGGNSNASIAPGNTGGEAAHTLNENELPVIDSGTIQWHGQEYGSFLYNLNGKWYGTKVNNKYRGATNNSGAYSYITTGFRFGGDGNHNNMPPYLAVYVWKRTA